MPEFGTFRDERDGCVYKTVRIGEQVWFAENFRHDCAGSKVYENDEKNLKRYGRLYTWYSAINAAPEGWRLPSRDDWDILTKSVGGKDVAAKVLKAREGWNREGNGTDEFGFNALPSGGCLSDGSFLTVGDYGYWWSASDYYSNYVCNRSMGYDSEKIYWNNNDKSYLFSVRLLRC